MEVSELPHKVVLRHYRQPMDAMRSKGYSFREIAEFFAEKLGVEVNRNQVVYLLSEDPSVIEFENKEDDEEAEIDHCESLAISSPAASFTPSTPPPEPPLVPPLVESASDLAKPSKKASKPKKKAK
jgi:hypothetical protein